MPALHRAAQDDDVDWGKTILQEEGPGCIDKATRDGWTALHRAALYGHHDFARFLVEEGNANIEAKTEHGLTPLHLSIDHNRMEVTKYLLSRGGDRLFTIPDNGGKTPVDSLKKEETEIWELWTATPTYQRKRDERLTYKGSKIESMEELQYIAANLKEQRVVLRDIGRESKAKLDAVSVEIECIIKLQDDYETDLPTLEDTAQSEHAQSAFEKRRGVMQKELSNCQKELEKSRLQKFRGSKFRSKDELDHIVRWLRVQHDAVLTKATESNFEDADILLELDQAVAELEPMEKLQLNLDSLLGDDFESLESLRQKVEEKETILKGKLEGIKSAQLKAAKERNSKELSRLAKVRTQIESEVMGKANKNFEVAKQAYEKRRQDLVLDSEGSVEPSDNRKSSSHLQEIEKDLVSASPTAKSPLTLDKTHPCMWALSYDQLLQVRDHSLELFGKDNYADKTMRDINMHIIEPVCREFGTSYALYHNPDGLHTDVFVTHCWDEPFGAFVESIETHFRGFITKPNLWICAFGLVQGDVGAIQEQLGVRLEESPFVMALQEASSFLVVRNDRTDLYSRIWCVCELFFAKNCGLVPNETAVIGPDTFSSTRSSCLDAASTDSRDKARILRALLRNEGDELLIDDFIHQFRSH